MRTDLQSNLDLGEKQRAHKIGFIKGVLAVMNFPSEEIDQENRKAGMDTEELKPSIVRRGLRMLGGP